MEGVNPLCVALSAGTVGVAGVAVTVGVGDGVGGDAAGRRLLGSTMYTTDGWGKSRVGS